MTAISAAASSWWGSRRIHAGQATDWVTKARKAAEPLLAVAGPVADPAPVVPRAVHSAADAEFGNFMLAWLQPASTPREVNHLPDGAFFLQLLRLAYAPVLERRPELAELLDDDSRLEMSLTNDVLQIQLIPLAEGYSMIRHHALMLFCAALWLDEPRRSQWLELYDELVRNVDALPGGRPGLDRVAEAEAAAFAAFVELAPRTLDAVSAAELLATPSVLTDVLDYQLFAGVAIGLLWREYRALPEGQQPAWLASQLSDGYVQSDYLVNNWTEQQ